MADIFKQEIIHLNNKENDIYKELRNLHILNQEEIEKVKLKYCQNRFINFNETKKISRKKSQSLHQNIQSLNSQLDKIKQQKTIFPKIETKSLNFLKSSISHQLNCIQQKNQLLLSQQQKIKEIYNKKMNLVKGYDFSSQNYKQLFEFKKVKIPGGQDKVVQRGVVFYKKQEVNN